jgi:hypothetical protein
MQKRLFLSLFFLSALLFSAAPALAQNFGLDATAKKAQYGTGTDIYTTISTIIGVGLSMAGIVFLAIMLWAGLRWMTARGNEEMIERAKSAIFAAMIGFILVTVSYGISTFIFSKLIK